MHSLTEEKIDIFLVSRESLQIDTLIEVIHHQGYPFYREVYSGKKSLMSVQKTNQLCLLTVTKTFLFLKK